MPDDVPQPAQTPAEVVRALKEGIEAIVVSMKMPAKDAEARVRAFMKLIALRDFTMEEVPEVLEVARRSLENGRIPKSHQGGHGSQGHGGQEGGAPAAVTLEIPPPRPRRPS